MLIVGGAVEDFVGMDTAQLESRFEDLRQIARGLRQRMEQTREQMKRHDKKFQEGLSRENRNEYEAKQKRYKNAEHTLKRQYNNAMDEARDIREALLARRDPRAAAEQGSGLMAGAGKKGIPRLGESKSKASKAIKDFDRLSTREQRDALQHFGRVVKNYEDAQRFVRRSGRKYSEMMEELNKADSTEFFRSMRAKIEELERDRKKAYKVMKQLEDEYIKAKKYLDTEMTTLMPSIEEGDEPDPLAAAEEGSGIGAYFKKGKGKARDDLVKKIVRLQEEVKMQEARLAQETRPQIKALIREEIRTLKEGIRDFMGLMAGSGAKFSIAREAKVLPEPRVTILEQSESFDESIPDEEIPGTFEIPDAYTRPPVLAIEGKNDEDASYYSIVGEDEESFHTAEGSGISFSRQARVAPSAPANIAPRPQVTSTPPRPHTRTRSMRDLDQRQDVVMEEQEELLGIPDTFDIGDDDSYFEGMASQGIYFLGR